MNRIQKFRMFNAGETSNTTQNLLTPRGYNPYMNSSPSTMSRMGYGYNRMNTVQAPTTIQRASTGNVKTVTPTQTSSLGSGKSKRSITGETFNVPVKKRAKSKKVKEPLCDCGMPISQCQCEGHNHEMKNKKIKGSKEVSMRKSMCKCGSGMSKSMCKCGGSMGKNFTKGRKAGLFAIARAARGGNQSKVRYAKKPVVEILGSPELTGKEKIMRDVGRIGPYMQGIPTEASRMAQNFFGNLLTNIGNTPLKNLVTVPMKPRKKNDLIPEYLPASGLDDGTKRVFITTAISEATRPSRAKMMSMLSQQNRKKLKTGANIARFGILPLGTGIGLGRAYESAYGEKEKSSGGNSSMKKSITRMGAHVVGGYRGKNISKAMKASQSNLSNKYM